MYRLPDGRGAVRVEDLYDTTVIEAVLTAEGDKTRLVVEERGLPAEKTFYYGAGWQVHLEDLAAHLAGGPVAPWKDRWLALTPDYQTALERGR